MKKQDAGRVIGAMSLAFIIGCAVPVDPRLNATGQRVVDGEVLPFSENKELLLAGLVDDGIGLIIKNRYFEAEGRLRQAQYLDPANTRILFNLALALNQTGQSEEAEQILQRLNDRKPKSPDILYALADAEAGQQKYEEAVLHLKEIFNLLKPVKNVGRMALIARSISNMAFRGGNEADAICYSYEAYTLAPSPDQLGYHARMLVALGHFESAKDFIEEQVKVTPSLAKKTSVKHSLAVARFIQGDIKGALEAENQALDFLSKEPELGGEVNAAWYVIRSSLLTGEETEKELKVIEDARAAALDFREVGTEYRLFLPAQIVAAIDEIPAEEE